MRYPTASGVVLALKSVDPAFLGMPMRVAPSLNRFLRASIVFKDETANPIRSFKGRGGSHYIAGLATTQPLVCASAGNFGQGMAWGARRRKLPLVVFAARSAVACKIDAMRRLGADVRLDGDDFDAAKNRARSFAQREGFLYVEDGAHVAFAEGAGTLAFELTRDTDPFDVVLVPLGNGALAAGVGTWIKNAAPTTQVVAVAAVGAPAMAQSVRTGIPVEMAHADTIADGIAVRVPIPYAVDSVRRVVYDVVLVSDADIRSAMDLLRKHLDLVVEPAGAVGLAAVTADPERWRGRRLAVPLCGGNLDEASASVACRADK